MRDVPQKPKLEQRTLVGSGVIAFVGLLAVWFVVDLLWAHGWDMHLIHLIAIFATAMVTVAAAIIVVLVILRYRRILERRNQELERLATVGETVAGIAHFQKNLLNGLRGGVYVTDVAVERGDPDRLRTGWKMLRGSIQRIEKLTLDMLYYVKGRIAEREPTNLNELVREAIDVMRGAAEDKGVELAEDLAEAIEARPFHRIGVMRALLNLIGNAIDACAESERDGLVTIRSCSDADEIILLVEDNGAGMTAEVRASLFTRFFSTKGGQGTGLGLPVVAKVVDEHGGTLSVESAPGQGSTFRLVFPKNA